MTMTLEFRSPLHERAAIEVPEETARLDRTFNGSICSRKGDEYLIRNNIIDLLEQDDTDMSWAQYSNHWKLTAYLYETLWRKRSLSLLTGEDFPIDKESELLLEWLAPQPDRLYLDIGCSTALYARRVKHASPGSNVVALDFSMQMLEEARLKAEADQTDMYLVRADARFMPFFGKMFDGLMCGGTLNELTDPLKVLFEARRVIKDDGALFMMHLLTADTWYGRLLQDTTEWGGLQFWTVEESNDLFTRAGFSIDKQQKRGIVCFTRLVPV